MDRRHCADSSSIHSSSQATSHSGKPVRVWTCRATDYGRKESRKVLFVFGEPCVALLAYVYNGKVLRVRGL